MRGEGADEEDCLLVGIARQEVGKYAKELRTVMNHGHGKGYWILVVKYAQAALEARHGGEVEVRLA